MANDPDREARLERLKRRRAATAGKRSPARSGSAGTTRNGHPAARSRRFVLGASALTSVSLVVAMGACSANSTQSDSISTSDSTSAQSSSGGTVSGSQSSSSQSYSDYGSYSSRVYTTRRAPVTRSHAS